MDDGDQVTEEEPSSRNRPFSDAFREVFPWYMAIGMSYDEFWNQDPYLAVYYREMHEFKRDEENQKQWWQGLYTYIAISTALSNIHLDGKKHKINQYLQEPLRIRPKTEEELEADRQRAIKRTVMQLDAFMAAFNESHKGETEDAG